MSRSKSTGAAIAQPAVNAAKTAMIERCPMEYQGLLLSYLTSSGLSFGPRDVFLFSRRRRSQPRNTSSAFIHTATPLPDRSAPPSEPAATPQQTPRQAE